MKRPTVLVLIAGVALTAWAGRYAWRAYHDTVSIVALDLPVREVLKKLEWQTWEDIEIDKDIDGRVTLRVENQPLTVVLDLIGEQVGSRWTVAYPLYSTKAKLNLALRVARGEVESPQPGWTNWNARPGFAAMAARFAAAASGDTNAMPAGGMGGGPGGFGGFGGFGGGPGGPEGSTEARPVTVTFESTPPLEAALRLREFGRVKVVPEDGTTLKVNLDLKDESMDGAVKKLAKAANRKWAKFYAFEGRRGGRPDPAQRELIAQQFENIDRDAIRQRFEQTAQSPEFQARMEQRELQGLLNSTPEQRAERDRRRAQFGGRGGPGGGGGGGRGPR